MEIHIQSLGARLRMRGGIFILTTPDLSGAGNQKDQEYAPHQVELILLYEGSGSVSADAMVLAFQHQVDILLCDRHGMPLGRMWSVQGAAPVLIQAGQFRVMGTPRSMEFVREWLGRKFRRKMAFLERLQRYRKGEKIQLIQTTRQSLSEYYTLLQNVSLQNVPQAAASFRGIEGNAARVYFGTLSALLQPEYQFDGRSRRPARDLFNALLNYGYGMLYRLVEKSLIEAGINPFAGFHHGLAKRQKAMVFDVIEAYRPWVDNIVFALCSRKQATPGHIQARADGYWLSNAGKSLLIKAFQEFFHQQQVNVNERVLSPAKIMAEETRAFAAILREVGNELAGLMPEAGEPAGAAA